MRNYKIVIFHYQPLEFYPPIQNLLAYLDSRVPTNVKVVVCSSYISRKESIQHYTNVRTKYFAFKRLQSFKIGGLINYILFSFRGVLQLIYDSPDVVLYYETYSSFPIFFYRWMGYRQTKIFTHYHEYLSNSFFEKLGGILKILNRIERTALHGIASWISHTNEDRLKLFYLESPSLDIGKLKVLPNYPPKSWKNYSNQHQMDIPIRVVYVGSSITLEGSYLKEMCEWAGQNDCIEVFDIYDSKPRKESIEFVKSLKSKKVSIYPEGIPYQELPGVLIKYNVGTILYKTLIENYKYNAPNKLFEYLACGLDVWFPKEMLGCYPYISEGTFPKVMPIDFKSLNEIDFKMLSSHKGLDYKPSVYFCEPVYERFYKKLMQSE